jgi:DNA repair protein RadA/Sms
MAKNSSKTVYVCSECGFEYAKWQGKCRECGSWDTLEEQVVLPEKAVGYAKEMIHLTEAVSRRISDLDADPSRETRYKTGISEFDRAVGGGLVKSSVVLLSGEPGIGKSTLLLQICRGMANNKILYVSG